MKIYLILNNDVITGYSFNKIENAPEVEISDPTTIKLNIDTYEDNQIISHDLPQVIINQQRILELKQLLADSDYLCLKHADEEISDEEYAEIKAQRHAWRVEINELESE